MSATWTYATVHILDSYCVLGGFARVALCRMAAMSSWERFYTGRYFGADPYYISEMAFGTYCCASLTACAASYLARI